MVDTNAQLDLRVELEALLREMERVRSAGGGDRGQLLATAQRSSRGVIVLAEAGEIVIANRVAELMWSGRRVVDAGTGAAAGAAVGVTGADRYKLVGRDGKARSLLTWAREGSGPRGAETTPEVEQVLIERFDGSRGVLLATCASTRDAVARTTVCVFAEIRPSRDAAQSRQAAHHRASFLVQATTQLLSCALDPDETLRQLAELTVPAIADACVIDVLDEKAGGRFRRVAVVCSNPSVRETFQEIESRYAPAGTWTSPALWTERVTRTGSAELYCTISDELLMTVAKDAEHLDLLRSIGMQSVMITPLRSRRGVIGAVGLGTTDPQRRYGPEELGMAEQLANCGGIAVENARLYRYEQQAHSTIERTAARMQRLQAIMTELGGALTLDEVALAVVDHGVAAAGASEGGIWMFDEAATTPCLRRVHQKTAAAYPRYDIVPVAPHTVFAAAIWDRRTVFVGSRAETVERYPVSAERFPEWHAGACFPLVVQGRATGVLLFVFDAAHAFDSDERAFLQLMADQCAEGLRRASAYEAEQRARSEMALLYGLLDAVNRATTVTDVYDVALEVVERAMGVARSAIEIVDGDGVMRFKGSRGISEEHRRAVEGTTLWSHTACDPAPVFVPDLETDPSCAAYGEVLRRAGIRALGFLPLVHHGQLLGMLVVYSPVPRAYSVDEVRLARTIAAEIAQAVVRKRAEAEVEAARAAAEYANRMKDEFLALVSHELRAPLSAIVGWAAILQTERRNEPALLSKGLGVIDRNAKAQATMIDDILDVSRITRGKLVLDARPVSLVPILVDTIESLKTSAAAKEIEVDLDVEDDRYELVGDPERLRQIAWNLLSNAVKFTPARGRVCVRLRRVLGTVVLEVEDTGRGIGPEFLPYVFDRFRQADSSTTRREGGLGLGLSIVRHLVELHGGQVAVRSDGRGKGSTFSATFPVRAVVPAMPQEVPDKGEFPGAVEQPSGTSDESPDLHGVRALVVDDQKDAREILKEALVSYGAVVEVAGSGREALEVLPKFQPTVLVTDIGMPDEDGYEFLRRVRALPDASGRVPAIAVTAYARVDDVWKARQAGFQSHVAKPARPEALAREVAQTHAAAQLRSAVGPST